MIVVDASVVIDVLLGTAAGRRLADRVFDRDADLHAPHLLDLEVLQVLRRYAAAGELKPGRAREAVDDLADLPITRHQHVVLASRIWELRHNLTAYDAAYVALAEALEATLLTRDAGIAALQEGRRRKPGMRIELV
jgi:predicted nucleic acid-binding protein